MRLTVTMDGTVLPLTIMEYSLLKRVHPSTTRKWIKAGELPAELVHGKYMIRPDAEPVRVATTD